MIKASNLGNLPVIYCVLQVGEMFEVLASLASSGAGRGPELAQLLSDEGAAFYAQRRVDAAERRYSRALQADPDHVASLYWLVWLLKNEKNDVITARVRPALTGSCSWSWIAVWFQYVAMAVSYLLCSRLTHD